MTTILVPSHLVGSVLLSASKISCTSRLTALFLRAAASWRRETAALARDRRAAVGSGDSGGLAAEKDCAGPFGDAERRVKDWIVEMGIT